MSDQELIRKADPAAAHMKCSCVGGPYIYSMLLLEV